ncbi:hypothetical protein, partial [Pseudomonas asplenii]|uniref:hypothetical protein n=1 Tax=Pseudomonas asplenii TaxID=53407 RepID=UPI002362A938
GRRILQRYTLLSTPLLQLPPCFDDLKLRRLKQDNSLNLKEFSALTVPEVGRIIGPWKPASTVIFGFLS